MAAGKTAGEQQHAAGRRRLDRIEPADRDRAEQQGDDQGGDQRQRALAAAERRQRRARPAAPAPRGHRERRAEHREAGPERRAHHVLRVDDAHGGVGEVHRLGVSAQHRVAEQQQHQRRRDDDAERAGDADRRGGFGRRDLARREGRRDAAREHVQAGADRAVHRCEQGADAEGGELRRGRAAREQALAAGVHQPGQGQPIEERADEGVERQRLQQVVLEQADDAGRQGTEKADVECAAGDADRGEDRRDGEQHGVDRQAGRGHEDDRDDEHREAEPAHGGGRRSLRCSAAAEGCGPEQDRPVPAAPSAARATRR